MREQWWKWGEREEVERVKKKPSGMKVEDREERGRRRRKDGKGEWVRGGKQYKGQRKVDDRASRG